MASHHDLSGRMIPRTYLYLAVFIGMTIVSVLSWQTHSLFSNLNQQRFKELEAVQLSGQLLYLNEARAMSAHMATHTDKVEWQQRHEKYATELEKRLTEVLALNPPETSKELYAGLLKTNEALVRIEKEASPGIDESSTEKGKAILETAAYLKYKREYQENLALLEADLANNMAKSIKKSRHILFFYLFSTVGFFFIIFIAWLLVNNRLRKNDLALLETLREQEQAKKDTRQQARILHQLSAHTPLALALLDDKFCYLMATSQWVENYTLDADNLIGRSFFDFEPRDEASQERIKGVMQGIPDVSDGTLFETSQGKQWFRWENLPWYREDGRIGGLVLFFENITKRKVAEQSLKDAESRHRQLIESLPDFVMEIDNKGTILFANRPWALDGAPEDSSTLYDLLPRSAWSTFSGAMEAMQRTAQIQDIEISANMGGKEMFFRLRLVPLESDECYKALLICSDFTQEKKAVTALHHTHRVLEERVKARTADLERANEDVKSFAYIISHDLRAPLVNIRGFLGELRMSVDLILSHFDKLLPQLTDREKQLLKEAKDEDMPEAMSFIESSVARMDQMIGAVLKLSRLGRKELQPEDVDIGELVHDCLENLAYRIEQNNVQVSVGEMPILHIDRTAMIQIFANILTNAVNYLQPGRPGVISVVHSQVEDHAVFEIKDNGRGINEEDLPKVFEIFRRIGKSSTKGEGMGMAYVKALVTRLGGTIKCESTPGEGTTITFSVAP